MLKNLSLHGIMFKHVESNAGATYHDFPHPTRLSDIQLVVCWGQNGEVRGAKWKGGGRGLNGSKFLLLYFFYFCNFFSLFFFILFIFLYSFYLWSLCALFGTFSFSFYILRFFVVFICNCIFWGTVFLT